MKARTAQRKHQRRARGRGNGTSGLSEWARVPSGSDQNSPPTLLLLNSEGRLVWDFVIKGGSKVAQVTPRRSIFRGQTVTFTPSHSNVHSSASLTGLL